MRLVMDLELIEISCLIYVILSVNGECQLSPPQCLFLVCARKSVAAALLHAYVDSNIFFPFLNVVYLYSEKHLQHILTLVSQLIKY